MGTLRKLISILLLAIVGLAFVSPLLAVTAKREPKLPACCRRIGKHHCMTGMDGQGQLASKKLEFHAPAEQCPYCPASVVASHHADTGLLPASAQFAEIAAHPSVHAQTESLGRIARDRSRNKRGPPSLSLL